MAPHDYPNGALVFCSEALAEAVHPPLPLRRRVYSCGRRFDTSALREAIEAQRAPAYGIVVLDGPDCSIGVAQGLGAAAGVGVRELTRLKGDIHSRTGRGGQSAARFGRLREEAELAFIRRSVEHTGLLLKDTRGLVVAGKAEMKRKFVEELPPPLRRRVLCVLGLPCGAGLEGLRQAALRAGDAASADRRSGLEAAVDRFLELAANPKPLTTSCCYGDEHTAAALEMGAVETLLVAADRAPGLWTTAEWAELSAAHGAAFFEVSPRTEQEALFCGSFGVGGCLRWPVDLETLEGTGSAMHPDSGSPPAAAQEPLSPSAGERSPRCASASAGRLPAANTPPPGPMEFTTNTTELLAWLGQALVDALEDAATAEALVSCAEVLFSQQGIAQDEVVAEAAELLSQEGVPDEVVVEMVRRSTGTASRVD